MENKTQLGIRKAKLRVLLVDDLPLVPKGLAPLINQDARRSGTCLQNLFPLTTSHGSFFLLIEKKRCDTFEGVSPATTGSSASISAREGAKAHASGGGVIVFSPVGTHPASGRQHMSNEFEIWTGE